LVVYGGVGCCVVIDGVWVGFVLLGVFLV